MLKNKKLTIAIAICALTTSTSTLAVLDPLKYRGMKFKENGAIDVEWFKQKGHKDSFCSINSYKGIEPQLLDVYAKSTKNDKLCYEGFSAVYSQSLKMPLYSAMRIDYDRIFDGEHASRPPFLPDATLVEKYGNKTQVNSRDYVNTGWDRGHLSPSRSFSAVNRVEAFYMSNIAPQNPNANRNVWAKVENEARCFAESEPVYVVTIPAVDLVKYKNTGKVTQFNSIQGKSITVPSWFISAVWLENSKQLFVIGSPNKQALEKPVRENFDSPEAFEKAYRKYDSRTRLEKNTVYKIPYELLETNYGVDPFPFLTKEQKAKANTTDYQYKKDCSMSSFRKEGERKFNFLDLSRYKED